MRNLRHLAQLTAACTEPFMRFDLDYNVNHLPRLSPKLAGISCTQVLLHPCRAA